MRRTTVAGMVVLVLGAGLFLLRQTHELPTPVADTPLSRVAPGAKAPADRPATADRDPASGTIDGRVINGMTHEGVAGAELMFLGDSGVSTFRTARDGNFVLVPSATGSLTLAGIAAPGYLPYASPVGFSEAPLTLARGRRVHGLTLLLYPAVEYEGLVVDSRGAPVAGVRVRRLGTPGAPELAQDITSSTEWTTGQDGRFTFQAARGAVLEATRAATRGWAEVDRTVEIMHKLTIHLGLAAPHDATISGRVRDISGTPVGDAHVRATPSAYYGTAPSAVAVTSADGRFEITGVDRVAYDLSITATGYLTAGRSGVAADSRDLDLVLGAGRLLAGHVVDARGEPIASYTLVVQRRVGLTRAPVERLAVIDPRGRFELRVASGDYDLIVSVPGEGSTAVQATAGATDVRIALGRAATLRGRVISEDDDTPIAGASVGIDGELGVRWHQLWPRATTDSDGRFELVGIAPGPVGLTVYATGYARKVETLPAGDPSARGEITIALSIGEPPRAPRRRHLRHRRATAP